MKSWDKVSWNDEVRKLRDGDAHAIDELIDAADFGAFSCDATGRITRYNQHAAAIWGESPNLKTSSRKYFGAPGLRYASGDSVAEDQCCVARAIRLGFDIAEDLVVERRDHSFVPVLVHASPIRSRDNDAIKGAVVAIVKTDSWPRESNASEGTAAPPTVQDIGTIIYLGNDRDYADHLQAAFHESKFKLTWLAQKVIAIDNIPSDRFNVLIVDIDCDERFDIVRAAKLRFPNLPVYLVGTAERLGSVDFWLAHKYGGDGLLFKSPPNTGPVREIVEAEFKKHRRWEEAYRYLLRLPRHSSESHVANEVAERCLALTTVSARSWIC